MQVLPHLGSGGLVSGAIEVAKAVINSGGISIVVTSGGYRKNELDRIGSKVEILPVESKNIFTMKSNVKKIISIINKYDVSLMHVRSRAPAWSCLWVSKRVNIPLVTTFHGTYGTENIFKKIYNKVMISGDKTIAISEFIAEHISEIYNYNNTSIIPRGVNTDIFSPENVTTERLIALSKKLNIDEVETVILLPARRTEWKGHIYAIEALSIINNKKIRLIMVGDIQNRYSYKKKLMKYAKKFGVQDQIHIFGHSRDMAAVMMLSDVVLSCPRKPEAFGRVILEAQAMGRPIVAFNHGGAKELIKNNKNGWLVEPFDLKELAKILQKVINLKQEERHKLAIKSIANVKKNYLTNNMSKNTIKLYLEVMKGFDYERKSINN